MDTNPPRPPILHPTAGEIEAMVAHHAPPGWQTRFNADGRLSDLIRDDHEFTLMVVVADVRSSTLLQKEALSFRTHAAILTRFVESAADTIRVIGGGWFDRFTGDGFLSYWTLGVASARASADGRSAAPAEGSDPEWTDIRSALTAAMILHWSFGEDVMADFRANSQNVPATAGLAIGMDMGPAHFAPVAGDLTILGAPVVGAERMVTAAKAGEIVANIQVGRLLERHHAQSPVFGLAAVRHEVRTTKEFPAGQEVYVLEPSDDQIAQLARPRPT